MDEVEDEGKGLMFWVKVGAASTGAIFAISAPILYLCGVLYEQGYLSSYGLDSEFFVRSISEYHATAFIVFLLTIIDLIEALSKYFLWVVGGIAIVLCVGRLSYRLIDRLGKREGPRREVKHFEKVCFDFVFSPLVVGVSAWSVALFATVLLAVFLIVPCSVFYNKGKEAARKGIEKAIAQLQKSGAVCGAGDAFTMECIYLSKDGHEVSRGAFVARSSTHIAIFDGRETTVYPLGDLVVRTALPVKK